MVPDIHEVLNYPERGKNKTLENAFKELGVKLIPFGKKRVFGVPVLGMGWSSVVVYGIFNSKKVAIKVQRADSNRISLRKEASFLKIINKYGIGPTLYHEGEGFLIMEYLEGDPIREAQVRKKHILNFLEQCHRLDLLGIDHGQIQGGKHLIVGDKCWIIDFEKAAYRTPRNVSSLLSELFLKKTKFARKMKSDFGVEPTRIIEATHQYKHTVDIGLILDTLDL